MVFVDQSYVSIARKTEVAYHERKVSQLERTLRQITEALAREHQQHHSRLLELEQVEKHLSPVTTGQVPGTAPKPTLKPLPSSTQKWSQVRKHHRHHFATPALPHAS